MSTATPLLVAQLRRERVVLPIWIAGIALLAAASAAAVISQFGTDAERTEIVAIAVVNPAFLFMRGAPDGISAGALTFFQVFSFSSVSAALMSMFLVTRHSRASEEDGRAELELATAVSRSAPLRATLAIAVAANVALAAAYSLALIASGLPSAGSVLFGVAVASTGVFFAGVTALVAQLAPTGRSTNAVVGAAIGLAFVVRGIGDALGTAEVGTLHVQPNLLARFSPIGWGAATRPYTEPQPWLLLVPVGVGVLLALIAVLLRERRDLGASVVAEGRGHARMLHGASPAGLAWRQSRLAIISWTLSAAALGALGAALSPLVASVVSESDSLAELIGALLPGTETDVTSVFLSGLIGITGLLAACAAVQVMLGLRSDERTGRSELLLSAPITRTRLVLAQVVVAGAAVLLVTAAVGAAVWVTTFAIGGTADAALAVSGLAHAPAAAVFIAVPALVIAVAPRAAVSATWALLAIGVAIGQFGELLALPEWLRAISPFSHSAAVPVESVKPVDVAILLGIAVLGAGLAAVAARRRDLVSG